MLHYPSYKLPLLTHMPTDMKELRTMMKDYYTTGFEDGRRQGKNDAPGMRNTYRAAGSSLAYAIRAAQAEETYEGLPTVAIIEMLGMAARDASTVRRALKDMGYKQRSCRYRGTVVKGWCMKPARRVAMDEEDLPI